MIGSLKLLIGNMKSDIDNLRQENQELRKRLQFSHTKINDLRYSRRQILKHVQNENRNTGN